MNSVKGLVALIASSVCFGLNTALIKHGLNTGLEPVSFAFLSLFFTVFFLLPYYLKCPKKKLSLKDYKGFALLGVLASGVVYVLIFIAMQMTSAINVSILSQTITLFTVAFAVLLLKEKITTKQAIAGFVMMAGAVIVSGQGQALTFQLGDLLVIAMALVLGYTNTFAKKLINKHHSGVVSFWRMMFGIPFLFIAALFLSSSPFSAFGIFPIVNAFLSAVTVASLYYAFYKLGVSMSSLLLLMNPIFGVSFAMILLGEELLPIHFIGGLLIIIGAALLMRWR